MMANGIERPLKDCLVRFAVSNENKIKASEIKAVGKIPVVDQGKAFVAGFTDESHRTITEGLPLVIFGDHTRCFKYVDFPFVLGADGTKVLKPNEELLDPKYFYFACLGLDVPNRGYNRHFTILKELPIRFPEDLELQRRIANMLGQVEGQLEVSQRRTSLYEELLASLVRDVQVGTLDLSALDGADPVQPRAQQRGSDS